MTAPHFATCICADHIRWLTAGIGSACATLANRPHAMPTIPFKVVRHLLPVTHLTACLGIDWAVAPLPTTIADRSARLKSP